MLQIRNLQGQLKENTDNTCHNVEQLAAQIVETIEVKLKNRAIKEIQENMTAKIDRVTQQCEKVENELLPAILECKEAAQIEEMVT